MEVITMYLSVLQVAFQNVFECFSFLCTCQQLVFFFVIHISIVYLLLYLSCYARYIFFVGEVHLQGQLTFVPALHIGCNYFSSVQISSLAIKILTSSLLKFGCRPSSSIMVLVLVILTLVCLVLLAHLVLESYSPIHTYGSVAT